MPPEMTRQSRAAQERKLSRKERRRPSKGPKSKINPNAERFAKAMAGVLAMAGVNEAKADEFQVGRPNVVDIVDGDTGNALPGSPVVTGPSTTIIFSARYIDGQQYTVLSAFGPIPRLLKRNNGSAALTILSESVTMPGEIHSNEPAGTWSVADGTSKEGILCIAVDPNNCERYQMPADRTPMSTIFSEDGPTPFMISVNASTPSTPTNTVSIHNIGGDLNSDGFPDNTNLPTELASISLPASLSNIQGAHYDRTNKVLYVICHNTRELWAFDIDDTNTTTLAATTGQVVATFNFDPHDLHVTPDGNQLVVGGDSSGAHLSLLNIGANASDVSMQVPDLLIVGGPLGYYQAISFDSDGELWVTQNGVQRATRIDISGGGLSLTTEYIYFTGYQLDAFTIAQDAPPTDPDNDGDGVPASIDCDDGDATVSVVSEFLFDGDGDTFGLTGSEQWLCGPDTLSGYTATVGGDCNDADPATNPGAPEVCGGGSEDCDPETDEPVAIGETQQYVDADSDGWGAAGSQTMPVCPGTPGFAVVDSDCQDLNPAINPGTTEPVCGGPDLNCDGNPPPLCAGDVDSDGDGYTPNQGDCVDTDPAINPGALEVCGGPELNCDGNPPLPCAGDVDGDGDGHTPNQGDCADNDPDIHPNAPEYADGRDKDCDTHPSAAINAEITSNTDTTLIGNPGTASENGPNFIKGLGESSNVKITGMSRDTEILDEEYLGYQTVDPSEIGQLRISREAGGLPVTVYELPQDAAPDYIPTWTAAVTGTVLQVLDQPSGTALLSVVEGTSVEIETVFYGEEVWEAYLAANPEASDVVLLSGPNEWVEIDKATGEILGTNVAAIEEFLVFVDEYQGDDDDSSLDDDDTTPDDDDSTPDDDDSSLDDDDTAPEDDDDNDSTVVTTDCEGCQTSVLSRGPDGEFQLNSQALALAVFGTAFGLRRRRTEEDLKRKA